MLAADPPAAERTHAGALTVLTRRAPRVPVEAFLALPLEGERLLWEDGHPGADGWAFAGRGAAARVEAWGDARLTDARDAVSRVFAQLALRGEAGAPRPRMFGGVAFQPQGGAAAPWAGFADASFVLPRWTYCVSRDAAFVRVAAHPFELRALEERLGQVIDALAAARVAPSVTPPSAPPAAPSNASFAVKARGARAEGGRIVEMDRAEWDEVIHDALRAIRRGDLEKVVASRRSAVTLRAPVDLPGALARMRDLEPTCTRFAVEREGTTFLGATPERLTSLRGLCAEVDALAGSIPRRDGEEIAELFASDKDAREHALVVDGIRAALAPFCASIDVPRPPIVRTLRAVHHLWTPIRASLRAPAHVLDLVAALHPTPAVCGLPRERARAWIAAHESVPRGWYASPVGWLDDAGEGQFAVAIRSALVKGLDAWLFGGAGIVEGSDAALEYRETGVKQTTMLAALGVEP
jgi:salicylate biosynthesis isochorismate synthase